jgi:hypothetical protein
VNRYNNKKPGDLSKIKSFDVIIKINFFKRNFLGIILANVKKRKRCYSVAGNLIPQNT